MVSIQTLFKPSIMKKKLIPIILFSLILLTSCVEQVDKAKEKQNFTNTFKTITVTKDIPYREGESDSWKLDLAMPANFGNELRPALVIIHGGGWRFGSKSVDVYQKMMVAYAQKGYVTINVEYRLTDEAEFPACIEDVKTAVRWLRAHAEDLRVDPKRIGSYGHSAGAHLSLMLAMTADEKSLEGDGPWKEYSSKVKVAGAGSPPTELGRDVPMAKKEWWPIGHIAADHPPMFLIQGTEDPIVLPERTRDFVNKMKEAGNPNLEYLEMEGDHGIAYNGQLEITDPALEAFFDKYLKP
jgi:acetyl esterase/lipase